MAQCLTCRREWNSWGGGYEFCNQQCFQKLWNEKLKEIADKNSLDVSTVANIISAFNDESLIRVNDNY